MSATDDGGDDGYVHTPDGDSHGAKPRGQEREFGLRGWILVGWLVVSIVVIPAVLFYIPQAGAFTKSLGLGYRDAFLVLPLLPALGLGALAVWATTRP
ncbi:hypothetical protein [Halosegnis marinus]|uniref:Uncharacterized protein n=1 Tax=Halosegnis marinus TaxID=3034023 RepID=A0ABD5ZL33_9EURY|nr:hypothetical protein [Halosegnis sp. DT85]